MKPEALTNWVDLQLHILSEYGFNGYQVHFMSDRDCELDPYLRPGDYESQEFGMFGDGDYMWTQKFSGELIEGGLPCQKL